MYLYTENTSERAHYLRNNTKACLWDQGVKSVYLHRGGRVFVQSGSHQGMAA